MKFLKSCSLFGTYGTLTEEEFRGYEEEDKVSLVEEIRKIRGFLKKITKRGRGVRICSPRFKRAPPFFRVPLRLYPQDSAEKISRCSFFKSEQVHFCALVQKDPK